MGFCIYCNKNVYSNTTCPKCYRTIPTSNNAALNKNDNSGITAMFPEQKRLSTNTDKWQDTYSKKAIFNNETSPINSKSRQRIMPHFSPSTDMKKMAAPAPESASMSTPVLPLATSRSTLTSSASKTNAYFQYQRSRRTSMFTRSNLPEQEQSSILDSALTSTSSIVSPRPKSPVLNKVTEEKNTFNYKRSSTAPPQAIATTTTLIVEPTPVSPPANIEPKNTESTPRRKKVIKKPCKECGQHVSKKDYRGLKIHTGEVLCFHTFCLFCAKCHQNFNGLEFCTDGKNFYHTECPERHHRQGSPSSEEEEPYPQTPPPNFHDAHFDIVSSSPTDIVSFTGDNLPKKRNVITPDSSTAVMCSTCTLPVTDSTCLELANHFYHKKCLLCAGCKKTVPTDRKLSKYQDKLYCDHCTPTKKKLFALAITTGLRINVDKAQEMPKRAPTITTPSDIFKSRKKVLPRLGGVRTCARCNESMPFSDTQPGPNASRWHKKCLRCTKCKKQMDSDAHMTVHDETGLCLVHCRECLDETPKPRFVR